MFNKKMLAIIAAVAMALTACGDKKDPKKSADEGNGNVRAINATNIDLANKHGIILNPASKINVKPFADLHDWSRWTPVQLASIKSMLNAQIVRCGKVNEIAGRDGVKLEGDPDQFYRLARNAQSYLNSLAEFERGASRRKAN